MSFPGNTPGDLGELVYRLHHHHAEEFLVPDIDPLALQIMHVASHVDLINRKIRRSISEGKWIVLDRFWWSTYVYGLDSGIPLDQIQALINVEERVWGQCKPDLLVFVDANMPLRTDETPDKAWHAKRHRYDSLASKEQTFRVQEYINEENDVDINTLNARRASQIISLSMDS